MPFAQCVLFGAERFFSCQFYRSKDILVKIQGKLGRLGKVLGEVLNDFSIEMKRHFSP